MKRTEFSAAKKIVIVEEYLRTCHQRGAVKKLCKSHGVSRTLVQKWLEQIHQRATVIFAGDKYIESAEGYERIIANLRHRYRTLWRELHPPDDDSSDDE